MKKHAIIGGGNIGTLMAAELAAKGKQVYVFASDAKKWHSSLTVLDQDERVVYDQCVVHATNDLQEAVSDADYIWITYPTHLLGDISSRLLPLATSNQKIGVVPGACAEFFFNDLLERGCVLFGLQRVHSVARLKERGRSVYMLGRKPSLEVSAIPTSSCDRIANEVEQLFDVPTTALPNYLALTLVPSNPILHTSRIASMFRDWEPGKTYPRNFLFYEEWTDDASAIMLACDNELQQVCDKLPLDLSSVKPLSIHYESPNESAMTYKISHIPAFKNLKSPMKEITTGKWVPDFQSRYFKSDFSYGLESIRQVAALASVDTPHINSVLSWYYRASEQDAAFKIPPANLAELLKLYA